MNSKRKDAMNPLKKTITSPHTSLITNQIYTHLHVTNHHDTNRRIIEKRKHGSGTYNDHLCGSTQVNIFRLGIYNEPLRLRSIFHVQFDDGN